MDRLEKALVVLSTFLDGHTIHQIQRIKTLFIVPPGNAAEVLEFCAGLLVNSPQVDIEGVIVGFISATLGVIRDNPHFTGDFLVCLSQVLSSLHEEIKGQSFDEECDAFAMVLYNVSQLLFPLVEGEPLTTTEIDEILTTLLTISTSAFPYTVSQTSVEILQMLSTGKGKVKEFYVPELFSQISTILVNVPKERHLHFKRILTIQMDKFPGELFKELSLLAPTLSSSLSTIPNLDIPLMLFALPKVSCASKVFSPLGLEIISVCTRSSNFPGKMPEQMKEFHLRIISAFIHSPEQELKCLEISSVGILFQKIVQNLPEQAKSDPTLTSLQIYVQKAIYFTVQLPGVDFWDLIELYPNWWRVSNTENVCRIFRKFRHVYSHVKGNIRLKIVVSRVVGMLSSCVMMNPLVDYCELVAEAWELLERDQFYAYLCTFLTGRIVPLNIEATTRLRALHDQLMEVVVDPNYLLHLPDIQSAPLVDFSDSLPIWSHFKLVCDAGGEYVSTYLSHVFLSYLSIPDTSKQPIESVMSTLDGLFHVFRYLTGLGFNIDSSPWEEMFKSKITVYHSVMTSELACAFIHQQSIFLYPGHVSKKRLCVASNCDLLVTFVVGLR
eukprot:TRINITY_DN6048_c0_g1_i5.p1 TRINITY_DN6048_c0_g1~~TRINITY_DN6048_c0_g1_i5.p1  ORF type:complete len:610 (+),score=117.19 TRINITY_DN6048_c0_g1_i5:995-2824(+)